jgi:hypothetical protein
MGAGTGQEIVGVTFSTTCVTVPDDGAKSAEPAYVAVTASIPTGSAEVVHVAVWAALSATDVQPLMAAPL